MNPSSPEAASQPADALAAVRALGQSLLVLNATTDSEIDGAFATLVERRAGALVVGADPFLTARRAQIAALAAPPFSAIDLLQSRFRGGRRS